MRDLVNSQSTADRIRTARPSLSSHCSPEVVRKTEESSGVPKEQQCHAAPPVAPMKTMRIPGYLRRASSPDGRVGGWVLRLGSPDHPN